MRAYRSLADNPQRERRTDVDALFRWMLLQALKQQGKKRKP
jgi:hypothetical protein